MSHSERVIVKKPRECSGNELQDFIALVRAGGEVAPSGLETRVQTAALLVFLTEGQRLLGIAALKLPSSNYRRSVSEKAGVSLETSAFPYEIGWVYVIPSARSAGFSRKLVSAAVTAACGKGMFATSRTDNVRIHRTLEHFRFVSSGRPYASDRGNYQVQLFIRHATRSDAPVDVL